MRYCGELRQPSLLIIRRSWQLEELVYLAEKIGCVGLLSWPAGVACTMAPIRDHGSELGTVGWK